MNSIPSSNDSPKLCECGCGRPTTISRHTDRRRGEVKGQPNRFIVGHNGSDGPIPDRFWRKVDKSGGPDACWPWLGIHNEHGYGVFATGGHRTRYKLAHRIAWQLTHSPIPPGIIACHHCDNPPCVNPAHIFLGTQVENMADCKAKGRTARGEHVRQAKITAEQVQAIRARYAAGGVTNVQLAREYNLSQSAINLIINRKRWSHL